MNHSTDLTHTSDAAKAVRLVVVVGSICFIYWIFAGTLPIEQSIATEYSPDGRFAADYSWRPNGILALYVTSSTTLFLTIRDTRTGKVIVRHKDPNGDTDDLSEARNRFAGKIPWQKPEDQEP